MNKVILSGRIVREWDVKILPTSNTPVATNVIAVDRYVGKGKEKETDFIVVKMFGARVDSLVKYVDKGQRLLITDGSIRINNYEDKSGNKKSKTEVIINDFEFIEFKRKDGEVTSRNIYDEDFGTPVDEGSMPF